MRRRRPLGGDGLVRLPARLRRRDQPARADTHRRAARRARRHAAPRCRVDVLRRRQPPRQRPRGAGVGGPVRPRAELARRGRLGPPAAQRQRGRQSAARSARPLPCRRPPRARRRRRPGPGRQDRAAARTVGARPARRRRTGTGGERRLARRLRLHQGARRTGPHRLPRCRAGEHRQAVDHRVGVGRAAPGLDPRLPDGRAGDPLLRPRPAARVPGRSRRHGRRHPRRPRRRRDRHRRRPRSRPCPADLPGRLRRHQPAEVPHARRQRQRVVRRAPDLRLHRPADRRPGVAVPRPRPGAGPAQPGQDGDQPRRAAAPRPAAAGQAGRAVGQAREQAPGGRAGARVRRAVRPVHRVRGDLPGRQPAGDVGRLSTSPTSRRSTSIRAASTGSATSARSTCRRSSSTPGSRPAQGRRRPTGPGGCAGKCCRRTATSPPSTWRTR